jgi:Tfp pilus assembly protein PilX
MTIKNDKQRGVVSLIVVMFATLLITVVTVSYVRIMVQDQQQATATDLSQSAYDSAMAGVEDAKRALLRYQSICKLGTDAQCDEATKAIDSGSNPGLQCNEAIVDTLTEYIGMAGGEVKVKTGNDNTLDQAYTCVKIKLNTDDFAGVLSVNESKIIPLTGVGDFNKVQIEWFNSYDAGGSNSINLIDLNTPELLNSPPLLDSGSWPMNRPPIMRAQMIQFGDNFSLADFDGGTNTATDSNANTLFLYPSKIPGNPYFINNIRKTAKNSPIPIKCKNDFTNGGYACEAQLGLSDPIGGGKRTAFLRLNALYSKGETNYRIKLLNNLTLVKIRGIQPEIDSTGRANDFFRRVQARVELDDVNFPYPEAEVDISGNFCKVFSVVGIINQATNSNSTGCLPSVVGNIDDSTPGYDDKISSGVSGGGGGSSGGGNAYVDPSSAENGSKDTTIP